MNPDTDTTDKFRLPNEIKFPKAKKTKGSAGPYSPIPGEKFIAGPLSMHWFALASKQPGKTGTVGLLIWHLTRLEKRRTVAFNQSRWKKFGLSRDSARRGLAALEKAKLVSVLRHSGRTPRVTLLLNDRTLGRNTRPRKNGPPTAINKISPSHPIIGESHDNGK